jgi:hypothetical protein
MQVARPVVGGLLVEERAEVFAVTVHELIESRQARGVPVAMPT